MHGTIFSISGLYPLDVSSTHTQKCLQTLLTVPWMTALSPVEDHCLYNHSARVTSRKSNIDGTLLPKLHILFKFYQLFSDVFYSDFYFLVPGPIQDHVSRLDIVLFLNLLSSGTVFLLFLSFMTLTFLKVIG